MILTIDNNDGAGAARDYTAALDAERPARILRRLNRPSEIQASLYAATAEFVVPVRGARVVLARNDGAKLFTGYADAAPEHEYLGWGERGPVYRYVLRASSDEMRMAAKSLPPRADFVQRGAGEMLKILAADIAPGEFDASACEEVANLAEYWPDPRKRFHEHAAELARRARAAYRAEAECLIFEPIGETTQVVSETSPDYSPDGLKLKAHEALLNDVTVTGAVGPGAYVKDYFSGDGATLGFYLSETPFLAPGALLLDEEYRGATLRPQLWDATDPASAIAVSQGKLRVSGGTGDLSEAVLRFAEKIEIGGALALDHGEFEFAAPADALIGGLHTGNIGMAGCVAGFRLTPSGTATQIAAVVNGAVVGQSLTTAAGRRYALSTRIYASEIYRNAQAFPCPGGPSGGGEVASGARVILQVHEINPNDPASLVSPATVLYEGWLANLPACCDYVLINAVSMQASVAYTRLARVPAVEVRTCPLLGSWRTRVAGALTDGGECRVSADQLRFYPASAPQATEKIVVSYRAGQRTMARLIDEASIAAHATAGDDGRRCAVVSVASPTPRTYEECESAARAMLSTAAGPAWSGEYQAWTCFLSTDVFPGQAIAVEVHSQAAAFTAVVREVEIEAADLVDDRSRYTVRFATESAEPAALRIEAAPRLQLPDAVNVNDIESGFLPPAAEAEIVDIGSTEVMIDAGREPEEGGGGFEVRGSDSGWGLEDDRTLINRFDYRIFTVPRIARSQTWYLRPYDGAGKYSRVSTILHVDCAL